MRTARLAAVTSNGAPVSSWTLDYDLNGRLAGVSNSFGETSRYTYDGEGKLKKTPKGRVSSKRSYDTMSESERRELHQLLGGLSAMQSVPFEVEEPNGTYYEYDRNLKATVRVTPDGERTRVEKLETSFEPRRRKGPRKIAHEEIAS